jgi:hypothetical protein
MTEWRLIFTDGSTEKLETDAGRVVVWIKGKIRARAKGTFLLNVEEVSP